MKRRCSPWRRGILQRLNGTGKFCRATGERRARLVHKYRHGRGSEPEWYRKRELAALRKRIRELERKLAAAEFDLDYLYPTVGWGAYRTTRSRR